MASRRAERSFAFVLSILVHAAIVVALTFSVSLGGSRPAQPIVVPIEAVLIDESAVVAEMARIEAAEEAERQAELDRQQRAREEVERLRQLQEEEQRELERVQQEREEAERERLRLEAEAVQRAEAEAERLRIAELERAEADRREQERLEAERIEQARLEAERIEQERLEAERLERERIAAEERAREEARLEAERQARIAAVEAETARAIEAERQARAARDSGLRDQWARTISDKVTRYWTRPPNVTVGLECVLEVTQLPNGEVINVEINRCNTSDQNIIRSVENAVLNASPLPSPPNGVAFERVVLITFRPDE